MSGSGLIRLLAERLAGRATRATEAPALREVLMSRMAQSSERLPTVAAAADEAIHPGLTIQQSDAVQPNENWVDLYSGMRGDPNRPWRGHIWGARDRNIAQDYGPNVREMQGDISGAVTIRTLDDLRRALGPRADLAAELRGGDVFAHLDQPAVREALREQGVRAVRVTDDMTPTQPTGNGNNWHESYLMLDEGRIRARPTPSDATRGGAQPTSDGDLRLQRALRERINRE